MNTNHNHQVINGIDATVLNETVSAVSKDPELGKCVFKAQNKWVDGSQNLSEITGFFGAKSHISHKQKFKMLADEPALLAGKDEGANPVEYLLHALASCLTTSMVAHAAVRGIKIDELESEVEGDINLNGFLGLDPDVPKGFSEIRIKFTVKTDEKNLGRLRELTTFSPVYNTLINGVKVDVEVNRQ
ncbi:MAG: OsmC family protein [Waddliaceae bacterium]